MLHGYGGGRGHRFSTMRGNEKEPDNLTRKATEGSKGRVEKIREA